MRKEYRRQKAIKNFVKYMRRTWKNKLIAITAISAGMLGVVLEKDATALVFMMFFAVPMFFSSRDWTV